MLTKSDLQQIGKVIDSRLDQKLDSAFSHIKNDLGTLKKDLRYIKKTIDLVIKNYDEADVKLEKRVSKIEEDLDIVNSN